MDDFDRKYLDNLIRHTEESIRFLSNEMKPYRERCVCAAFLRCLGIAFSSDQIKSNNDDPPDIIFNSAQFEVMELYDSRRKRLDEFKNRLKELQNAKTVSDTLIEYIPPTPMPFDELRNEITQALSIKSKKYGKVFCSSLDALVYVALPYRFLDIKSQTPDFKELISQGWRSVSFVMPPFSHTAFCNDGGPDFLLSTLGQTKHEWGPDGVFDLD